MQLLGYGGYTMIIVICDDNIETAKRTQGVLKKFGLDKSSEIRIKSPQDVYVAVEEELFKCDIFITEIDFVDKAFDGIKLVSMINEKMPACQVIYMTSNLRYASLVYETKHCYFLLKDSPDDMLIKAVKKGSDVYKNKTENNIIEFLSNGHKVFISQSEIMYLERDDRLLNIHTVRREYPCYSSLRKVEERLVDSFARCHGGYIVNLMHVAGMETGEVHLKNGKTLPIGKRFFNDFKDKYLQFFEEE